MIPIDPVETAELIVDGPTYNTNVAVRSQNQVSNHKQVSAFGTVPQDSRTTRPLEEFRDSQSIGFCT